jgi:hypothetical protein
MPGTFMFLWLEADILSPVPDTVSLQYDRSAGAR